MLTETHWPVRVHQFGKNGPNSLCALRSALSSRRSLLAALACTESNSFCNETALITVLLASSASNKRVKL